MLRVLVQRQHRGVDMTPPRGERAHMRRRANEGDRHHDDVGDSSCNHSFIGIGGERGAD